MNRHLGELRLLIRVGYCSKSMPRGWVSITFYFCCEAIRKQPHFRWWTMWLLTVKTKRGGASQTFCFCGKGFRKGSWESCLLLSLLSDLRGSVRSRSSELPILYVHTRPPLYLQIVLQLDAHASAFCLLEPSWSQGTTLWVLTVSPRAHPVPWPRGIFHKRCKRGKGWWFSGPWWLMNICWLNFIRSKSFQISRDLKALKCVKVNI